jgi:hypothetical protein
MNKFRFALELIDIDRLQIDYFTRSPDGRQVRCGVEFAPSGEIEAYHVLPYHPADVSGGYAGKAERVEANGLT